MNNIVIAIVNINMKGYGLLHQLIDYGYLRIT
jgi:hypothetical protein